VSGHSLDPEIRFLDLEKRVREIEARQRAEHVHDPDCATRNTIPHPGMSPESGARMRLPGLCDCWLSREPS